MKRYSALWQLAGFAVTSLLGTLLHFLYGWTGASPWVAPFAAVNESTWEHMKLLFVPMLLFACVQGFFFRERKDFWQIKLQGILWGLFTVPVLFYTYNGAVAPSSAAINVAIFFIACAVGYGWEACALRRREKGGARWALPLLGVLAAAFFLFTFFPPHIGLFLDPLTDTYSIWR